jgi:hypothetical protein
VAGVLARLVLLRKGAGAGTERVLVELPNGERRRLAPGPSSELTRVPDAILADLDATPPLIVFVECVVTDGPINERRKHELEELALGGGFLPTDCAYVTTFLDRDRSPFKRMAASLAWGTFVWFSTEPEHLVFLRKGGERGMVSVARLLRL